MTKLLKRPELLKESNRDFDFFSFDKYAENLHNSLKSNTTPTVTTLIGKYGTGKSVLLNEVKKLTDDSKAKSKPKWVFFECWQYPDKRDLWEALIIELVDEIDGKKLDKTARTYSDIKGWRDELARFLNSTRTGMATLLAIAIIYGIIFAAAAGTPLESLMLGFTTAAVLVLLASIEIMVKPQSKSSISRLSDYKTELENTLKGYSGPLYIVLEDVDRAGELGRRFFETVSHFVKDDKFAKKNIKVIVPVADIDDRSKKALHDSIDKASDNILYFKPAFDCSKFITEVFSDDFLDAPTMQLLVATINPLVGQTISVRKMKHLFRNSLVKHGRLVSKDFNSQLAMCIAVEFSKHMSAGYGGDSTLFSHASSKYDHKPLCEWAQQKNLLDFNSDDPTREIQPSTQLKQSDEVFADIRYIDVSTGTQRSRTVTIYRREFLISRAYFDDL